MRRLLTTFLATAVLAVATFTFAPAPTPAAAAAGCARDTASDLRWVSWLHLVHAGYEPTLPESARWLSDLVDGAT
ncbi:MAG TPA: hypothetical protein PKE56_13870, partial [Acidimicrobiales bacterium]|nr:hypothetical protein [Acidimicrobiales bacterium]